METDVKTLTELADKILKQTDVQIRYSGVCNLESKIEQDFNSIIVACRGLISENSGLRFAGYICNYYNMVSNLNFANKCLRLCMNHSDSLKKYENEPDEKRIERRQKLNQYDGVITIGEKSPDLIYCENGSYRIFNEVCQSFEYRLCREIQKTGINNDELKTIFQIVCLDIALRNELRIINDEASLLGIPLPEKDNFIKSPDKEQTKSKHKTSLKVEQFKQSLIQSPEYRSAINSGLITEPFTWNGESLVALAIWLVDNHLIRKGAKGWCWSMVNNVFVFDSNTTSSEQLRKAGQRAGL